MLPTRGQTDEGRSNYRKYGVISSVKAEDSKRPEKKDAVANKKGKVSYEIICAREANGSLSSRAISVAPLHPRLHQHPVCRPARAVSVWSPNLLWHAARTARSRYIQVSASKSLIVLPGRALTSIGCYGIASQDMGPAWLCELCHNVEEQDNHLVRASDHVGLYGELSSRSQDVYSAPKTMQLQSPRSSRNGHHQTLTCSPPSSRPKGDNGRMCCVPLGYPRLSIPIRAR